MHFPGLLLMRLLVLTASLKSVNLNPAIGEFTLRLRKFDPCQGPKRKNCSVVKAAIIGASSIFYDIIIKENMKPTKGKIVAMLNDTPLMRLQADRPCEHLFLKPLFKTMMNVTDDCVILKGHYNFSLDLEKVANSYYQGSFLYGNLTFKSTFYSNVCNLSCTVVKVSILPKEKS